MLIYLPRFSYLFSPCILINRFHSNNTTRNALIPLGWTSSQIRSALDNPSSIFSSSSSRSSDSELHLLRQAYAHGFRNVFILLASLAAFAFSVALFMMPQVEVDRKDDEALRERARREAEEKQAVRQQASESAQVPGCSIRK